ncbi:hypothetical protein J4209_05825 [Candidatus Woesearchaeota archaeon]|nr:hypothetical protein [Candidatus Woesearchaeota archaeon]
MAKPEKTKLYIATIAVLIMVILVLLGNSWYAKRITTAQQQGYNIGLQNSVVTIIQQSRNCQPVNLFIENQSFQFIDVICLQAAKAK